MTRGRKKPTRRPLSPAELDELEQQIRDQWAHDGLVLIDGQLVPEDDGHYDWDEEP